MDPLLDVLGNILNVGDRVGVAFSYSQASVGHIRLGVIHQINGREDIKVFWDAEQQLSPRMHYGHATRWIKL